MASISLDRIAQRVPNLTVRTISQTINQIGQGDRRGDDHAEP
jgi:hypothetical protein